MFFAKEETEGIKVICGLGNPGTNYAKTRHNCGFMLVDRLAERYGARWQTSRFKADICRAVIEGQRVLLVKPLTYMNNSGEALQKLLAYYRYKPEQLLVAYDDLDVALGTIRVRERGSAGSHNGMRSIVKLLGSQDFPRIRIGIGPKPPELDIVDFVLGVPCEADMKSLDESLARAEAAVALALKENLLLAMSRYNGKTQTQRKETDGEHV